MSLGVHSKFKAEGERVIPRILVDVSRARQSGAEYGTKLKLCVSDKAET